MCMLLWHNYRFDAVSLSSILAKCSKIAWLWEEPMAGVEKNPMQCLMIPLAAEEAAPCLIDGCQPCPEEGEEKRKRKWGGTQQYQAWPGALVCGIPQSAPGRAKDVGERPFPWERTDTASWFLRASWSPSAGSFCSFNTLSTGDWHLCNMEEEDNGIGGGAGTCSWSGLVAMRRVVGRAKGSHLVCSCLRLALDGQTPKQTPHEQVLADTFSGFVAWGEERLSQDVLPASTAGVICHHRCPGTGEYHCALG